VITGLGLGLLVCRRCRATVRAGDAAHAFCPRCSARLHPRKPHSLWLTTLYVSSAALLYLPANLLPVMHTRSFYTDEDDTIMSGVLVLLHSGSWPLAVIVFVASIAVPLLKLVALAFLLLSIRRRSWIEPLQRSKLFRLIEFVGRWSMLDVFVVGLLVALVQFQSVASIRVGSGALAFSAVVVLTMLAAQSFDERLIWDDASGG
jgi:paraquat-inducible protein A